MTLRFCEIRRCFAAFARIFYNERMAAGRIGLGRIPVVLLLIVAPLASCGDLTATTFETGEISFSVSAASVEVPMSLQDDGRIAELPCPADGVCPSSELLTLTCERSLCNPAPRTVTSDVAGVIDFDELTGDLSFLFRSVDTIEIIELSYTVQANTLSVDLDGVEIFWGPEGAVDLDPALGVQLLGAMPFQSARTTSSGFAELDYIGTQALSDYLVSASRRIRIFVRTRIDLEPGGPLPEGDARVVAHMKVRVSGPAID